MAEIPPLPESTVLVEMTPAPGGAPANRKLYRLIPVAAVTALLALLPLKEGYRHYAYYDAGGVLTVCGGLTGPDIVAHHYYSDADCTQKETVFLTKTSAIMSQCLDQGLTTQQWIAWGHWVWNIGPSLFCRSKARDELNAGHYAKACEAMMNMHYAGGLDCYVRRNRCPGIITRRRFERALCLSAM